jgi:hypothetical protein
MTQKNNTNNDTKQTKLKSFTEGGEKKQSPTAVYPNLSSDAIDDIGLLIAELRRRAATRGEKVLYLRSRDLARTIPLSACQVGTYLSQYVHEEPGIEVEQWSQTTYRITIDNQVDSNVGGA